MNSPRTVSRHALLEEIAITHRFTVVDSGFGGVGGGEGGGLCGDGVAVMPKGFPPVALYTLQAAAYPGRVMLAEGPQNVYYERTIVPTNKQVGIGSCTQSYNRMSIRIAYLARLASEREDDVKRLFQSETSIRYSGLEDLQHQIEQALNVQEDGIRALIRAIEKSGLPASNIRLRIVPELDDKRQQRIDSLSNVGPGSLGFISLRKATNNHIPGLRLLPQKAGFIGRREGPPMHTGEARPMNYGSRAAKLATLSTGNSGQLLHVDISVDIGRYRPSQTDGPPVHSRCLVVPENSAGKLGL